MTQTFLTDQQESAQSRFARLKVGALFMQQGTGKTRIALQLALNRGTALLWLCPTSSVDTIRDEIAKWGHHLPVLVTGYQSIATSDTAFEQAHVWAKMHSPELMIVADESIFMKNPDTLRSRRAAELRRLATHALILNGTPVVKDLHDLKAQIDWLSPKIINMSEAEFLDTYYSKTTFMDRSRGRVEVIRKTFQPNVAHLTAKISPYVYHSDLEFPHAETTSTMTTSPDDETRERYRELKDITLAMWRACDGVEVLSALTRMNKVAASDMNKATRVAELIGGSNAVVFCGYREEQRRIALLCPEAIVINGDTAPRERNTLYGEFRTSTTRPLLLTYGVGAYSLNLQHSQHAVFSSRTFSYGDIEQACGRIRRLGQSGAIRYTTLTTDLPISGLVSMNLTTKDLLSRIVKKTLDLDALL